MKYYYLKEGDIIRDGDESNYYARHDTNGNPIFVKMKFGTVDDSVIGEKFYKGLYPMRRPIKSFNKFDTNEQPDWK